MVLPQCSPFHYLFRNRNLFQVIYPQTYTFIINASVPSLLFNNDIKKQSRSIHSNYVWRHAIKRAMNLKCLLQITFIEFTLGTDYIKQHFTTIKSNFLFLYLLIFLRCLSVKVRFVWVTCIKTINYFCRNQIACKEPGGSTK